MLVLSSPHDHGIPTPITYEVYPGGEIRFGNIPEKYVDRVYAHLDCAADVVALSQLKSALDRMRRPGVLAPELFLPYVPYARQDRANEFAGNQVLAARWMCEQINAQSWLQVYVADAHSDVTTALLDRVDLTEREHLISTPFNLLDDRGIRTQDMVLIAPDAGARKAVEKIALGTNVRGVLTAQKVRDMKTGQISGTVVHDVKSCAGAHVLIADDICDGGRTFTEVAKAIRNECGTVESISLYVTHGLFSKGMGELLGLFDNIFCPYPWQKFRFMEGKGWGDFTSAIHERATDEEYEFAFPHFDSLTITRK